MRHRVAHRKLGRVTEHRIAMLRNQATALIRYEHIETTVPKAKELRPFVERLITIAKRGVAAGDGKVLHARRLVGRDLVDGEVVIKLFDTLAPRFADRPGGYTRILRLAIAAATAPKSRSSSSSAASTIRRPRRSRGNRPRRRSRSLALAAACVPRPIGSAARRKKTTRPKHGKPRKAARPKAGPPSGRRRKKLAKSPSDVRPELGSGISD